MASSVLVPPPRSYCGRGCVPPAGAHRGRGRQADDPRRRSGARRPGTDVGPSGDDCLPDPRRQAGQIGVNPIRRLHHGAVHASARTVSVRTRTSAPPVRTARNERGRCRSRSSGKLRWSRPWTRSGMADVLAMEPSGRHECNMMVRRWSALADDAQSSQGLIHDGA